MTRLWLLAAVFCLPAYGAADPPEIEQAVTRLYNFDFSASHDMLNRVIGMRPRDPLPYSLRASAYLFSELDRLGILESEFFIDDKQIIEKKKLQPDAGVRTRFQKALEETQSLADAALRADPNNREALFAMCIAQGVTTDYMALVEKKQFQSLSPARKSNDYAQRLLKLEPSYYDAYISTGISEYMLGSLPFFIRWFVHFDNVNGNKQRGVENLQLVARQGRYFKPFAKILLGIIALREKKPQEAQRLLVELAHEYPDNPLFRKELSKLNSKLGLGAN
jgi:tetratricopeptide (TPR) repeat protein